MAKQTRKVALRQAAKRGALLSSSGSANQPVADLRPFSASGFILGPNSVSLAGFEVQLIDKNAGPDVPLARATTDPHGHYEVTVPAAAIARTKKTHPDLQAHVYSGKTLLASSAVVYNATSPVTLDVQLPANCPALPSEYETLTAALAQFYKEPLSTLQENDERQDITYLANKSGWDARLVAYAALADQFSRATSAPGRMVSGRTAAVPAPFYYALFRAGLPTDPATLHLVAAPKVQAIWTQAIAQGVIPAASKSTISRALRSFQALGTSRVLDDQAVPGTSSLKDLLSISLGADAKAHQRFAAVYASSAGDPERFWSDVQSSFGPSVTARLQLDSRLAALTLNNAPLIAALHGAARAPLTSTLDLVSRGLHDAAAWQELLANVPIPDAIQGESDADRRRAYAEALAAQVRITHPTAVVGARVQRGEYALSPTLENVEHTRAELHAFLTSNAATFDIGSEPVDRFLVRNKLTEHLSPDAHRELRRLQRIHQVTPSDEAMIALTNTRFDSAARIARYDASAFEAAFNQAFTTANGKAPDAGLAGSVHARARQVHNVAANIATSYLVARRAPAIGVHSPAHVLDPSPKGSDGDAIAYATLSQMQLAGDYCTCPECRSILSPAAYLVDLLDFIDIPGTNGGKNPQEVLFSRRPDIAALPLTCENTNTALPYIDLVNETLEYFAAHGGSLANYAGHTTDDRVTSAELLASPRFTSDQAYVPLKSVYYPPPLPFNQPLESIRRYVEHFDTPLHKILELFRASDALEPAAPDYGWLDIRLERLRIWRDPSNAAGPQDEFQAFTDSGRVGLDRLVGDMSGADPRPALTLTHEFIRRFAISYDELVALLKTTTVNPGSALVAKLERLALPFPALQALNNDPHAAVILPAGLELADFGGDENSDPQSTVAAWVARNYSALMGLITIAIPGGSDAGNPEKFALRYADPSQSNAMLRSVDFIRLIRFIRLWKKLGWSIEQTDRVLISLDDAFSTPPSATDSQALADLDRAFQRVLPRLGVVVELVDRLGVDLDSGLPGLLTCWSDIDNRGVDSSYRRLFLGAAQSNADPAFAEDSEGEVLTAGSTIADHLDTLRAAFNLTGDELGLILGDLQTATTDDYGNVASFGGQLTLSNISAIYRRGWLARRLQLSVSELLALARMSGINPFGDPEPTNPPLIRFVRFVDAIRSSGLTTAQALYTMWNKDLSGISAPDARQIMDLVRAIRRACAGVDEGFTIADDPSGALARSRMASVYGTEVTDQFFGLLTGSTLFSVAYPQDGQSVPDAVLTSGKGALSCDAFHGILSFAGVMSGEIRDDIKTAGAALPDFNQKIDELYQLGQNAQTAFLALYPGLEPAYLHFTPGDYTGLLQALLPTLSGARKVQQAIAAIGAAAGSDVELISAILNDPLVLTSVADPAESAMADFLAVARHGLSLALYWSGKSDPDAISDAEATLRYDKDHPLPGNPTGTPILGIWKGYLEVPESAEYKLAVHADGAVKIEVMLDGSAPAPAVSGDSWETSIPLSLTAGRLHPVQITVTGLTGAMTVTWETATQGWEVIPGQYLYSDSLVSRMRDHYLRFLKIRTLSNALELTPAEISYLATDRTRVIAGAPWVRALPVGDAPAISPPLGDALSSVLEFARAKGTLAHAGDRYLRSLQMLAAETPDATTLLALTRWDPDSFAQVLARFGLKTGDLADLLTLRRVSDAMELAATIGVPASLLCATAGTNPDFDAVRAFQGAVRARFAPADWLDAQQRISDDLRTLQRDALVAYALQLLEDKGYDTADRLFEYFLMDIQMDSCAQTSRIRHALSAVQLFIERCLLNLEQDVQPGTFSAAKAEQWSWMRRYRVWQANREIFLWPENWLDLGIRADMSPIFKDTMTALLRQDITADAAAGALQDYLSELEQVAKLEPCGMCYDTSKGYPVVHVVASTAGAHRKYYHCQATVTDPDSLDSDSTGPWTPWEQIKLDIEDIPVAPVVFKKRLLLFWLRIQKTAPLQTQKPSGARTYSDLNEKEIPAGGADVSLTAVLCWSEYTNGKWQATKTSPMGRTVGLGTYSSKYPDDFSRSHLRLCFAEDKDRDALRIVVQRRSGRSCVAPAFVLFTTHSAPVPVEDTDANRLPGIRDLQVSWDSDHSQYYLTTQYYPKDDPKSRDASKRKSVDLLRETAALVEMTATQPMSPSYGGGDPWSMPFIVSDNRHAFYVIGGPSGTVWPPRFGLDRVLTTPAIQIASLAQPNPTAGGPGPIRASVSPDAFIHVGLQTDGAVQFTGRMIGPAGQVAQEAP